MNVQSIMHVSFYTDHLNEMIDFYVNQLGARLKVLVRYREYLNRNDRPAKQAIARKDPDRIFNAYLEIAPGQFLELFPAAETQKPKAGWNKQIGYSHFALLVDDINIAYEQLIKASVRPDTERSMGPSGTWQFWIHDPDGNRIEIMQYTENSYQVTGHLDE